LKPHILLLLHSILQLNQIMEKQAIQSGQQVNVIKCTLWLYLSTWLYCEYWIAQNIISILYVFIFSEWLDIFRVTRYLRLNHSFLFCRPVNKSAYTQAYTHIHYTCTHTFKRAPYVIKSQLDKVVPHILLFFISNYS
jgi:hypothetical protein